MRTLIPILSILTLLVVQALADEPRTLTIHGTVDPRLDVSFMSTYRGTNIDRLECSDMNPSTGRRKVKLAGLSKRVTTSDYNITMPIDYTDANECGYEFVSIDLIMRRKYDDKNYAQYLVFSKSGPILSLFGNHVLYGVGTSLIHLDTENIKPYFRLAKESVFLCKTEQWTTKKDRDDFICTLQMKFDTEGGQYHKNEWGDVNHPEFKINELQGGSLKIDVKVDELKEPFRELPKPSPSVMEPLKSLF
ncbi:MAG: hypothetical protein AB1763_09775 [Campylobacterota bacterium]